MKLYRKVLRVMILISMVWNTGILLLLTIGAILQGGTILIFFNTYGEQWVDFGVFAGQLLITFIYLIGGITDQNRKV